MLAIFFKELAHCFKTPLGYLYLALSFFISGLLFTLMNLSAISADFASVLQLLQILLIFTIPLLTMRLFSEEKRHHTDQLLLTSGVPIWKIVVAKIKAASVLFFLTVLGMLPCLLVIEIYGSVDWLRVLSALLGYLLLGQVYICVGTFLSCLTENQMMAAVGTFAALFFLWLLQVLVDSIPRNANLGPLSACVFSVSVGWFFYHQTKDWRLAAGALAFCVVVFFLLSLWSKNFFATWLRQSLTWLSLPRRYNNFLMGVIKWGDLAYLVGLGSLFGYFSVWKLEKRRWSED